MSDAPTSFFTPAELEYIKSQRLCRVATSDAKQQPHVTPVSFRYNAEDDTFDIGGAYGFATRKRWKDVEQNPQIAFVIDDVASTNPWTVRGIEVRGTVELRQTGGENVVPGGDPQMFHITPKRIVSWGIEGPAYGPANARSVNS